MKKCKQCLRIKTTVRERRYNIVYEERKKKQPDTHKCEQQHKKKTIRMIGKKISFFQFEELQTTRKNAPLLRVERKKRGETIKLTTTNEN